MAKKFKVKKLLVGLNYIASTNHLTFHKQNMTFEEKELQKNQIQNFTSEQFDEINRLILLDGVKTILLNEIKSLIQARLDYYLEKFEADIVKLSSGGLSVQTDNFRTVRRKLNLLYKEFKWSKDFNLNKTLKCVATMRKLVPSKIDRWSQFVDGKLKIAIDSALIRIQEVYKIRHSNNKESKAKFNEFIEENFLGSQQSDFTFILTGAQNVQSVREFQDKRKKNLRYTKKRLGITK